MSQRNVPLHARQRAESGASVRSEESPTGFPLALDRWLKDPDSPWVPRNLVTQDHSFYSFGQARSDAEPVTVGHGSGVSIGAYAGSADTSIIASSPPPQKVKSSQLSLIMTWVEAWLRGRLLSGTRQRPVVAAGGSSGVTPGYQTGSSSEPRGKRRRIGEGSQDQAKKHKEEGGGSHNDGGGGGDGIPPLVDEKRLRYACPFYKHNHRKYGRPEWRSCRHPGWLTVHRVKEHLYRRHILPRFQCPRCLEDQGSQMSLDAHLRMPIACLPHPLPMQDGLNAAQTRMLERRSRTIPEIEKWQNMYRICFPDDVIIPSPYQEQDEDSYNSAGEPGYVNLADAYRQYLAREMPALVRRRLPEAMSSAGTQSIDTDQLGSIVRDLLSQLYGPFCAEMGIRTNSTTSSTVPDGGDGSTLRRSAVGSTEADDMSRSISDGLLIPNDDNANIGEGLGGTDWIGPEFSWLLDNFDQDYQQVFPDEA